MQFTCENCQRRYSIPDEKVRGKQVKVRCKSCDHVTTVSLAAAPEPEPEPAPPEREERTSVVSVQQLQALRKEATKAPAAAAKPKLDVSAQWFAMVKGAQVGPLDAGMLGGKFRSGELHARTYIWKQGMGEWKRAEEIPEIAALLSPAAAPEPVAAPPPPVARARPPTDVAVTRPVQAMKRPVELDPAPRVAEPVRSPETRVAQPIPEPTSADPDLLPDSPDDAFAAAAVPAAEEERPRQAAQPQASLDTLFSDEDLPPSESSADAPGTAKASDATADDPFAGVGGVDPNELPPPGEATQFFMKQAGVTRRNPPWKIALFIGAGIGIPVLILFALSQLNVVPLTVTHVNAEGQEVKESVFSSGGMSGLGDLLLGKNKKKEEPAPAQQQTPPPEKKIAKKAPDEKQPPPEEKKGPTQEELAAFYGNNELKTVGPKVKIQAEKPALEKGSSLDEEQVAKVVGQSMTAFQGCIETELRKNPNLKVGKITVSATVAASGTVTKAEIDKTDVNKSPLGDCLRNRARRMVFASFQGDEEAEIQIPLMVTTGM